MTEAIVLFVFGAICIFALGFHVGYGRGWSDSRRRVIEQLIPRMTTEGQRIWREVLARHDALKQWPRR